MDYLLTEGWRHFFFYYGHVSKLKKKVVTIGKSANSWAWNQNYSVESVSLSLYYLRVWDGIGVPMSKNVQLDEEGRSRFQTMDSIAQCVFIGMESSRRWNREGGREGGVDQVPAVSDSRCR